MKLLVIGQSAREHALAWKLAQSPGVDAIFVAPGNAGTAGEPKVRNIAASDPDSLLAFAQQNQIDLTVVGPCAPLQQGMVNLFEANGLKIFGATKEASELEWSKIFAKDFMRRHGIPTPRSATFIDPDAAKAFVRTQSLPIVIKADGLVQRFEMTVAIALKIEEADAAIDALLSRMPGEKILVEEFIDGEEVSFTVMSDGKISVPLATCKDHKRLLNNDAGPNTGGMGAYSPSLQVTDEMQQTILRDIVEPTLRGMAAEGNTYRGFLYVGVIIDRRGRPYALEYNARLGDPEAVAILFRLDSDLLEMIESAINGKLEKAQAKWDLRACVSVCVATPEYPHAKVAHPVPDLVSVESDVCKLFFGSAVLKDDALVATGGRAFCVTTLGDTVGLAAEKAYRFIEKQPLGAYRYRTDIGI